MRKKILSVAFICICSVTMAQSHKETVEYQKINRDAIINEIPFPEKTISAAILDTLQKLGYKGKESKGFMVYKGVTMPVLGKRSYDLYFSVERKSKKEKESSVVTLMLAKEFDDFVTDKSDPDVMDNAKVLMDSLRNTVAIYDLEQQIAEQETVVKKNDKKLQDMVEAGEDYEKDKKKLEDKIESNKKAISKQQSDSDVQKQVLETLKAKRKS